MTARVCKLLTSLGREGGSRTRTPGELHKTMNDEKWIVSDRDHLGGKPRVQGTRISVAFLLECLASGMSVAEIVDAYPTLTENAVQGALRELGARKGSDGCVRILPRRKHASKDKSTYEERNAT